MINWKTTLLGLISGILIAISQGTIPSTPQIQKLAAALSAFSIAGIGAAAKDGDVTGGVRRQ